MSGIHTVTVQSVHAYTRSEIPWEMDTNGNVPSGAVKSRKFGWRLFHYISSGGMRTFGRTVKQMERERRQHRFVVLLVLLWLAWAVLYAV